MSIQDRIAKRLLTAHNRVLDKKGNGGWWTNIRESVEDSDREVIESQSLTIKFPGKSAKLVCEVAGDDESQVVGLQKYASLPDGYGMVFPYDPPRKVSFHMGTVPFPIDIMFVGPDNRVSKIIRNAEPGTRETWGMSRVSYVVEANGGFCAQHKIDVGDEIRIGQPKGAQLDDTDYRVAPADETGITNRFKDRDLVDVQTDSQPMDPAHFDMTTGYDPTGEGSPGDPTRSAP